MDTSIMDDGSIISRIANIADAHDGKFQKITHIEVKCKADVNAAFNWLGNKPLNKPFIPSSLIVTLIQSIKPVHLKNLPNSFLPYSKPCICSLFLAKSIGYIKVFAIKPAILPDIIELYLQNIYKIRIVNHL
ncbi:hypothetical protein V1478_011010 [Vespula squamosa]|uniref:Uncharacterized protein n=1 Tax=Vespula squamosa TaxID=30214 RepID=A0ABD2AG15_VESSQ